MTLDPFIIPVVFLQFLKYYVYIRPIWARECYMCWYHSFYFLNQNCLYQIVLLNNSILKYIMFLHRWEDFSQETEVTSTATRPVDNVVITTKGLQDRNIHILDGTTVENKGKDIDTHIPTSNYFLYLSFFSPLSSPLLLNTYAVVYSIYATFFMLFSICPSIFV